MGPPDVSPRVKALERSATLEINERSRDLVAQGRHIYRLGFGQSPFPVPDSVVHALRENAHEKDYLPVRGLPALREAVAAYHRRLDDLLCDADDVVVAPGSKELIYLLQMVVEADLALPSPSWVSYPPQAQMVGRTTRWIDTRIENDWKLEPEKLAEVCAGAAGRLILILNYPCNPTGATYTEAELRAVADVARSNELIVLADEIYAGLAHDGQHRTIARHYPEGTVVSAGLSKWCGAGGWRLGTLVFPKELANIAHAVSVVASETYSSTAAPIQHAAIRAFEGGPDIEAYLAGARVILKSVGRWVARRLRSSRTQVSDPVGAFYLFPSFEAWRPHLEARGIGTSKEMCERLLDEAGVALLPGSAFGRPREEFTARLSYVDFNGERALAEVQRVGARDTVDEAFLREHCANVLEGVDRLCDWFEKDPSKVDGRPATPAVA